MLSLHYIVIVCLSLAVAEASSATPDRGTDAADTSTRARTVVVSDSVGQQELPRVASSASYGYSADDPILMNLTPSDPSAAIGRTYQYLGSLRGPKGEKVSFYRLGSCCPIKTENGFLGEGLLDQYELTYDGLDTPIVLYVNIYDAGEVFIPQGLTIRSQ